MEVPVLPNLDLPALCDEEVPGRQDPNPLEERLLTEHVLKRQVLRKSAVVQPSRDGGVRQETLDLGGERDAPLPLRVVQGFDPQAVPGEE